MRESDKLAAEKDHIEGTEYWNLFLRRLNKLREQRLEFCVSQVASLGNVGKLAHEQGRAFAYREVLDIWNKLLLELKSKERK